jgi:hypothetical protein
MVDDRWLSRAMTHPGASLAAQAAAASMGQTNYSAAQIVSSWRFTEFSASYELPLTLVRPFRMSSGTISLQGKNLGLHTNYSGLDPNANVLNATEGGVADAGLAPPPRMWMVRLMLRR